MAVWQLIEQNCDLSLSKYPTSLQEDLQILQKDQKDGKLGFNKRNCVLLRKGEKEILYFLRDMAYRVFYIVRMNAKDALKEIAGWETSEEFKMYFTEVVCPLLDGYQETKQAERPAIRHGGEGQMRRGAMPRQG